jgi:hypothetical protein
MDSASTSNLREEVGRLRKIDVKVAGTGIGAEWAPHDKKTVLDALQDVWRVLDKADKIGTLDEDKPYCHGEIELYQGIFDTVDPPVWFLVGETDRTIVALGGRAKHVRGYRGNELIRARDDAKKVTMEPDVAIAIYLAEADSAESTGLLAQASGDNLWAVYVAGMLHNWQLSRGTRMKYEVLARKEKSAMASAPFLDSPKRVLIGTPLFVAQTE